MKTRLISSILLALVPALAAAADWPAWRGWDSKGVSSETGLPESWDADGDNLLWKADIGGRVTPIVMDGRVCVISLAEPKIEVRWQERVVCLNENTGEVIWDHRYPIYQTDIPHHRVGWASLVGDPETGTIYALNVGGVLSAFRVSDGLILWRRSLVEEVGRISGFGGRTVTPIVDGDLLITSFLCAGWDDTRIPRHRFYAFDKKTGDTVWYSTPGGAPKDSTYSVPVVGEVDGQRLLFDGNGDGGIYALQVATGMKVWGFALSKRGINSSVVVDGNVVYASHSEDNTNGSTAMGRVVALDSSQVTDGQPALVWDAEGFTAGYASPAIHNGILYHVDNSANLVGFDAKTGERLWTHNIGIAQRGSPTVADGKIFVMDVDGKFHILSDNGRSAPEPLDIEEFRNADGRLAQTNGSPAIANGRIFFQTVNELYAVGPKEKTSGGQEAPTTPGPSKAPAGAKVAHVQVIPAQINLAPDTTTEFKVRTFDDKGHLISESADGEWSIEGISGQLSPGKLSVTPDMVSRSGKVNVLVDGVTGYASVAVRQTAPYSENFNEIAIDAVPSGWAAAAGRFKVAELDGERVLFKSSENPRTWRTTVFTGDPEATNYVVQVDAMAKSQRRRMPDMGIASHRYRLELMSLRRELRIRSWLSELGHFSKAVRYRVEPDTWYTMKFDVSLTADGTQAVLRGKVWKRGEPEPEEWSIEAVHHAPHRAGSPGLYGYSVADAYYDNYTVTAKPESARGKVMPAKIADLPAAPQVPQAALQ